MSGSAIVVAVSFAVGLFCLGGGIMDWDWFMQSRRPQIVVRLFTRAGARVFYVLLGLGFIGSALAYGAQRFG